jgi:hypothetical protein
VHWNRPIILLVGEIVEISIDSDDLLLFTTFINNNLRIGIIIIIIIIIIRRRRRRRRVGIRFLAVFVNLFIVHCSIYTEEVIGKKGPFSDENRGR